MTDREKNRTRAHRGNLHGEADTLQQPLVVHTLHVYRMYMYMYMQNYNNSRNYCIIHWQEYRIQLYNNNNGNRKCMW